MLGEILGSWARSDWFAATAIAISVVSAVFSAYQARLAAKRLKLDETAKNPLVEPTIGVSTVWPDWYEQQFCVRNRFDDSLYVDAVVVKKPRNAKLISSSDKYVGSRMPFGGILQKEPPISSAGASVTGFPTIGPGQPEWMSIIVNGGGYPVVEVAVRMSRGSQRDRVLTHTLKIKLPIEMAKAK